MNKHAAHELGGFVLVEKHIINNIYNPYKPKLLNFSYSLDKNYI